MFAADWNACAAHSLRNLIKCSLGHMIRINGENIGLFMLKEIYVFVLAATDASGLDVARGVSNLCFLTDSYNHMHMASTMALLSDDWLRVMDMFVDNHPNKDTPDKFKSGYMPSYNSSVALRDYLRAVADISFLVSRDEFTDSKFDAVRLEKRLEGVLAGRAKLMAWKADATKRPGEKRGAGNKNAASKAAHPFITDIGTYVPVCVCALARSLTRLFRRCNSL